MKKENVVIEKSKKFALRIIKLYYYLCDEKKEYILSKQLLRSGTSIGANLKEGQFAQSPADFHTKSTIALKETAETEYWLELLHESGFIGRTQFESIYFDCDEILKLLVSITKTTKTKSAR